jgi:hypothetical protein
VKTSRNWGNFDLEATMNETIKPNNSFSELRLLTKSLIFLALVTGIIYLRVFIVEFVPAMSGVNVVEIAKLVLLLLAMLGLLVTFRREEVGAITAVSAGLLFAILVYTTAEQSRLMTAFFYSSPFIISGSLSFVCWRRDQP